MTASSTTTTLSITLVGSAGTKIVLDVDAWAAEDARAKWDAELRKTVGRGLVTIDDADGSRLSIPAGEILLMTAVSTTTEKSEA